MSGRIVLWVALLWIGLGTIGASPPAAPARARALQRALTVLQYVAGDYAAAVGHDGSIHDRGEFDEQITLMREVEDILRDVSPTAASELLSQAQALRRDIEARGPAERVAAAARQLHARITSTFDVDNVPHEVPSLAAGRLLYVENCVACHGEDGRADTPRARQLSPHPTDLRSARAGVTLSPSQVFNVVSLGMPGTAMASFETLEEAERWDLAFYVLALRHAEVVLDRTPPLLALGLKELSTATDVDLERRLQHLPPDQRVIQLARLRRLLPIDAGD